MRTRNSKQRSMVGLVMAFALTGGGLSFALNEQSGTTGNASSQELLLNANTLIGNNVNDKAGKDIGTVKDLLIDQSTGKISYIIISYGGMLGMGEENFSIPWTDVTMMKKDDELVMQVSEVPIGKAQTENQPSSRSQTAAGTSSDSQFNSTTLETVEGTVENVDNEIMKAGLTDSMVVLEIQTTSGTERVQIAPDDYLQERGLEFQKGDQVEVTGSRVNRDGEKIILASKVTLKKDGKNLTLRQQGGTPQGEQGKEISTKSKTAN